MGRDLTRGYASIAFDSAYFYWAYTVGPVVRLRYCALRYVCIAPYWRCTSEVISLYSSSEKYIRACGDCGIPPHATRLREL